MQAVHFFDTPVNVDAWENSRNEIEIGEKVGQGNYGTVFRGQLSGKAMSPKIYAHKQEMEFEGRSHLTVAVKMLHRKQSKITPCMHALLIYLTGQTF